MLERYEGKEVKVLTVGGEEFSGTASANPSGYGLVEFGVEEESLEVDGTLIFLSDIEKIEVPAEERFPGFGEKELWSLIGELLEGPCWIADILPERVPPESGSRYFAVDRYFRRPESISELHRRHAEILLRLNCYTGMMVSFDSCETWETDPDPEEFVRRTAGLSGGEFLRAVFPDRRTMVDVEPDDTYMTVFCPDPATLEMIRKLAEADGFFLWRGAD